MNNPVEELCKDINYCRGEITNIRAAISNKHASDIVFENAFKSLIFMKLYAPEEIVWLINAQIRETEIRNGYRLTGVLAV